MEQNLTNVANVAENSQNNQIAEKAKIVNPKKKDAKKKSEAKKEKLQITNISSIASRILAKGEKGERKDRESFYKYPEFVEGEKGKKFAGNKDVISGHIGKAWREKRRKVLDNFVTRLTFADAKKDMQKCKEIVTDWKRVYKEFYLKNDYSLNSVRQSGKKEELEEVTYFLELCKKYIRKES